ncbi:SAM-dependent methyltransferase [Desulfosarcina ovata subsp. sediminis]|uniref:SAM-dependent methyltransferase n=1 Tax=Desulfosarcina ovata subsp. sediminis TaxID=885957 RepID=A0A5K7ZQU3_9BACT|nr:class I SAM-dependent methyltransferase [Desulfosarcina ovata]BBO82300.1 SAM-dependent methyltransferase [Desulfosarcina ovata subsp. sediminis]
MNKIKTSIKNYWNWRSSSYGVDADKSAAIANQWQSIVHQLINGAPGKRALDIGTGTGQLAVYLARAGYEVTAIDISEAMIAEARRYAADQQLQIDFQTGDAESLDFADQSVDVIVSRNLLWTLPRPYQALMEWRRVLKPGGRLMLSDGLWMNTTWKRVPRLVFKLAKDMGRNGSRISLRFFYTYAALQKRLPFYEGVSLESALALMQAARFEAVTPYDTSRLRIHPYGASVPKSAAPPFFIASATR